MNARFMNIDNGVMGKPTCSYDTAMRQSPDTINFYLRNAVEMIDDEFGEGYAKKNPDLVASLVKVQFEDFKNCGLTKVLYEIAEAIENRN